MIEAIVMIKKFFIKNKNPIKEEFKLGESDRKAKDIWYRQQ
jgi:hypothetical protein